MTTQLLAELAALLELLTTLDPLEVVSGKDSSIGEWEVILIDIS